MLTRKGRAKSQRFFADIIISPFLLQLQYVDPLTDEQELADDLPDGDEAEVVALDDLQDEAGGVGDLEGGQDEHGDEPEEDGAGVLHVGAHEQGELCMCRGPLVHKLVINFS